MRKARLIDSGGRRNSFQVESKFWQILDLGGTEGGTWGKIVRIFAENPANSPKQCRAIVNCIPNFTADYMAGEIQLSLLQLSHTRECTI